MNKAELVDSLKKMSTQELQKSVESIQSDILNKFKDVSKILEKMKEINTSLPPSIKELNIEEKHTTPEQSTQLPMYAIIPEADKSNVVFMPAQKAEDTKVLVGDIEVSSVVRAKLDYNPELGFPVLHLEIVNPTIIHNV
jgi:hypothetical protein